MWEVIAEFEQSSLAYEYEQKLIMENIKTMSIPLVSKEDIYNNTEKNHTDNKIFKNGYKTWDNMWSDLEFYFGIYKNFKFMIFIKNKNIGKRDSLTLIRRIVYYNNLKIENKLTETPVVPLFIELPPGLVPTVIGVVIISVDEPFALIALI